MENEPKEMTRQEEIQQLEIDAQRHKDNAMEFAAQAGELRLGLAHSKAVDQAQLGEVLDEHRGLKPKGILNKILTMKAPKAKVYQVEENIDRLERAVTISKRAAVAADGRRVQLLKEVEHERVNNLARDVEKGFYEWVKMFKATKSYFYENLCGLIEEFHQTDGSFPECFDTLGLSPTIMVFLESHLSGGRIARINMFELALAVEATGAMYGEQLLEKEARLQDYIPYERDLFYKESNKSVLERQSQTSL